MVYPSPSHEKANPESPEEPFTHDTTLPIIRQFLTISTNHQQAAAQGWSARSNSRCSRMRTRLWSSSRRIST
jgi:hypothetical protein